MDRVSGIKIERLAIFRGTSNWSPKFGLQGRKMRADEVSFLNFLLMLYPQQPFGGWEMTSRPVAPLQPVISK